MRNFTTRMMIAAATVVVAAGVAQAQTMKAEIPFTFRAGDKVMAAGTYQVSDVRGQSGIPMFRIADAEARVAILLVPYAAADAKKTWQEPVLAFECTDSRCALVSVWTGYGTPAYAFRHPKIGKDEPSRIATVVMRSGRAE